MDQATWRQQVSGDFLRAVSGIASATIRLVQEKYGTGVYGRLYLKPGKRLASTLMTDREILVVMAGFYEQDPRTLSYVEHCLSHEEGRLEPRLSIVVHVDPRGDARLMAWAVERGLTILPLFVGAGMPLDIEEALCAHLYDQDPFDFTGPVRNQWQFFGRPQVAESARRLVTGQIQALFGIRRVGKTSYLHRVIDEARQGYDACCVMVDCSADDLAALSAGRLLYAIGGAVTDAMRKEPNARYAEAIPLPSDISAAEAGRILSSTIAGVGCPVILLIDEVDYITPSSPTAPHWVSDFNVFFRALRRAYQESCRQGVSMSIVVSGVSSYWFTVGYVDGVENSAMNFVPEDYLGPLERGEAGEMIATLGSRAGLRFDDEAAALMAETCSGMPYWIRRLGAYVNSCYERGGRPIHLQKNEVSERCAEFVEVEGQSLAYNSLQNLFGMYPDLSDVALAVTSGASTGHLSQRDISALGRYAILGDGLDASGAMVSSALDIYRRHQRTAGSISTENEGDTDAQGIRMSALLNSDEQVERLVVVSALRNRVELRMRELVLAVVRTECGLDPQLQPSAVLLSILPNDKRSRLARKDASRVVNAYDWRELGKLVRKRWSWFGKVFGDLREFEIHMSVVNDRPDAHAKGIDDADVALHRRSLTWLDERVEQCGLL